MIVYHSFDDIPYDSNTVLTMGTFDGVHLGHQAILRTLLSRSAERGARSMVITFDPHPQIVLRKPDRSPLYLLTAIQERLNLFHRMRVGNVLVIPFTREFAATDAPGFIRDCLVGKIGLNHMLIGYDHMFGRNRTGNEEMLKQLGEELSFSVEKVEALSSGEDIISSTKIRRALQNSELEQANAMLGYSYMLQGRVIRGDGRGRKLGIPTANIEPLTPHKLLPRQGVYLVSAQLDGQKIYGMANIGTRPTFTDDVLPTLEVHFLEWDKMLYDREIVISFLKFIREERKFASLDLFMSQLYDDRMTCLEHIEYMESRQTGRESAD